MRKCLIVTSQGESQREFATTVRALGFEAVCASSVKEAKECLRALPLMVVIVIDEWWGTYEDPFDLTRTLPMLNRPPVVVVQKVRLTALGNGADFVVHRDDPSLLGEMLATIELATHEQELAAAEAQAAELVAAE